MPPRQRLVLTAVLAHHEGGSWSGRSSLHSALTALKAGCAVLTII